MHIPDNFLSTPVWAALDLAAVPTVALVSRKARQATDDNRLPLLGVMGAFVFAAQMINFPVGIGTSGHLVGGTLLACVLGPWAASLVVTAILIIQALVFQDGGVLAMGANVINMAIVGVLVGYLPVHLSSGTEFRSAGVFIGAALSVLVSGVLALSELQVSGLHVSPTLLLISVVLFAVNALAEGAITLSVLRTIERLNPTVTGNRAGIIMGKRLTLWSKVVPLFATISIALSAFGFLFASTKPDGLEQLGRKLGVPFDAGAAFHSPVADYQIPLLGSSWFSKAGAGLLGLVIVYLVCALGGHVLTRARRSYS